MLLEALLLVVEWLLRRIRMVVLIGRLLLVVVHERLRLVLDLLLVMLGILLRIVRLPIRRVRGPLGLLRLRACVRRRSLKRNQIFQQAVLCGGCVLRSL